MMIGLKRNFFILLILFFMALVIREQRRAIETMVRDNAASLRLQLQMSKDIQELRREIERTGR